MKAPARRHIQDRGDPATVEVSEPAETVAKPSSTPAEAGVAYGRQENPAAEETSAPKKPARRPWLWAVLGALAVVGIVGGIAYYLYARTHESTDDAFIEGHVVAVSPRVSDHVAAVYVRDNQWVEKGQLLVELDPRDFETRLAAAQGTLRAAEAGHESRKIGTDVTEITSSATLDQAAAAVEEARAGIQTAHAAVATAQAERSQAQAQLTAAQAALEQAQAEVQAAEAKRQRSVAHLQRIKPLVPQHAASQESLDEAVAVDRIAEADVIAANQRVGAQRAAIEQAKAAIAAAESGLQQAEAGLSAGKAGLSRAQGQLAAAKSAPQQVAQSHSQTDIAAADTARAEAEARQAELNLSYTKIYAPVAGRVTRKSVEVGAYVQVGQPLLALVEPDLWVVANFKETQLTEMRVGQPVTVKLDAYPGVRLAARVESIQRGSGAHFSLLPPENATGNYVKVVQRVPVKIIFDDLKQIQPYALGPGMSVVPTVNVGVAEDTAKENVVRSSAP